jgi:hypothetical protein
MSRPSYPRAAAPFAAAPSRSAVECVVPWTDDARFDSARWETALEMLAEVSPSFRLWLVPMAAAERPFSHYDAAVEAMRRWPQVRVWTERGQRGLDRLNAMLDEASPKAIRVVADFSAPFRSGDLAEALLAGKRRPTAFGMGGDIMLRQFASARMNGASIRVDAGELVPFASRPVLVESESTERRLRPMGNIRKIRTSSAV